jgi:hypothetical protein
MHDDRTCPDDDADLWAMHPTIDADLTAEEQRHRAEIQAIAAAEAAELAALDHCRGCGMPLDAEDEPFTYCHTCLPAARAAEPWPLPEECP